MTATSNGAVNKTYTSQSDPDNGILYMGWFAGTTVTISNGLAGRFSLGLNATDRYAALRDWRPLGGAPKVWAVLYYRSPRRC